MWNKIQIKITFIKKLIADEITECFPPFSLEFSGLHLLPVNNNIKILKTVCCFI